jgi:hypothetical protein
MPQDTLLKWMNDLGVCFSYTSKTNVGAVDALKVLRPEWITNGVYKVITSQEASAKNGFISHRDIQQILLKKDDVNPAYRNTERDFILGMMRDFKLSYQVGEHEFIPMLTADKEPVLDEFKDGAHIRFEYDRPLPAHVLYSFIVQMKSDVDMANTWRKGVSLKSAYGDCRATVRFGREDRRIVDIYTDGHNKSEYLRFLRRIFEFAQNEMKTNVTELIEYKSGDKKALLRLDRLLKMFKNGKKSEYADDIDEDVNILDVLRTIAPDEVITELQRKMREDEDELRRLKARELDTKEMKGLLYNINETTKNQAKDTYAILLRLEDLDISTSAKLSKITALFSELQRETTDAKIKEIVTATIEAISSKDNKSIKDKLAAFVSIAADVVSLAPFFMKLCNLLWGNTLDGQ